MNKAHELLQTTKYNETSKENIIYADAYIL